MATNSENQGQPATGINRRAAMKKAAAATATAGLVWNAPRIEGLSLRPVYAAAQSGGGGVPANGALVNDNCQDGGGNSPFNLQVRNTTNTALLWEAIWRNRPYDTIPGLSLPAGVTHTVVPTAGGLFDHVFTSSTPLPAFGNVTITGGLPSPAGDNNCSEVENFIL